MNKPNPTGDKLIEEQECGCWADEQGIRHTGKAHGLKEESKLIEEVLREFAKKFCWESISLTEDHVGWIISNKADGDEIMDFIRQALTKIQRQTREEVIEEVGTTFIRHLPAFHANKQAKFAAMILKLTLDKLKGDK